MIECPPRLGGDVPRLGEGRLPAAGRMLESRRADRACLVRVSVAAELWLRGSKVRSEYYGARLQLESREVQADAALGLTRTSSSRPQPCSAHASR